MLDTQSSEKNTWTSSYQNDLYVYTVLFVHLLQYNITYNFNYRLQRKYQL